MINVVRPFWSPFPQVPSSQLLLLDALATRQCAGHNAAPQPFHGLLPPQIPFHENSLMKEILLDQVRRGATLFLRSHVLE